MMYKNRMIVTILILAMVTFFALPLTASAATEPAPELTLLKTADYSTVNLKTADIVYTMTVTNSGNVDLTDVVLTDTLLGLSIEIGDLVVDEVYTTDAAVDLGDLDNDDWINDDLTNSASVTGMYLDEPVSALDESVVTYDTDLTTEGALTINKEVPNVMNSAVMFDFTVYDGEEIVATGSAAETDSLNIPSLDPGTYTVVESSAVGYTTEDDSKDVIVVAGMTSSLTFVNNLVVPGITVVKTVDPTIVDSRGDSVNYTFTVTNTGDIPLENITLTDEILGLSVEIDDLPYTTTVAFDLDDLDASDWDGNLFNNTATVSGFYNQIEYTDTDGASVRYDDPALDEAMISIDKTVSPATVRSRNANVEYTFIVENTGDFPLYEVTITDMDLDFLIEFDGILAVGDDFTTTRAFDLEDLGTGDISDWTRNTFTNTAEVTAMYGDDIAVTPDEDTATVTYRSSSSGSSSSGGTTTTIPDVDTPAAPVTTPVTTPVLTPPTVIVDDTVPAAALPQTGGFDPLFIYALGALIAGGGLAMKRRSDHTKL